VAPFAERPELGHKTSRVSVGSGWRNHDPFEEVTVRAGYHDLPDPEDGYTPDAQIEIASVTVRHYHRAGETRFERATFADVLSLSPIDAVFHALSWKINVGMQTIRRHDCRLCRNGVIDGGLGGVGARLYRTYSGGKSCLRVRKPRRIIVAPTKNGMVSAAVEQSDWWPT